ncbi:MAG: PAS domain-containing protein, partial [Candidatus Tectomicrobia bacterium]|nr:PAS domain-containing protein [Candidatus Tectomicrobia bacterium]
MNYGKSYTDSILASLKDGLLVTDRGLRVVAFNPALEQLVGLSASQAVGRSVEEIFPGERAWERLLHEVLVSGQSFSLPEHLLSVRGGRDLLVELTLSPLIDEDGCCQGLVILVRERGSLKELEEHSRQAERLACLGMIAAGLAHEIKNPLAGIRGAAQLLARELAGSPLGDYPEVIAGEADRINRIIEELLDLARPRPPFFDRVNLHKLLDQVVLLERETPTGKRVTFRKEYDPSLPEILADGSQLTQVILNVIRNAIEAMSSGGEIRIRTQISPDYQLARVQDERKYIQFVKVSFQDQGIGIPEERMGDLFTPFYTTKHQGSGLGLAISH